MSTKPPFEPELPDQGPAPRWAESVRRELDQHAESLDAATRSRLNRARQSALMEAARPRWTWSARPLRVWLPAGAAAALALAVALHPTMFERGGQDSAKAPGAISAGATEDLELMQQPEGLELYEDQEFFAWLDESEPSPG